jgi:transketolase
MSQFFDVERKSKATRLSFGEELAKLGETEKRIVVLDADLSKSTRTDFFAKKFPDRFFNMGIAEANMIGVAAGLANAGYIPFAASFGCFLTGRFDQIRMSASFAQANVRLVGTHSGVGIGEDGHSQMALEDLALMRSLPNMVVFQPADEWETHKFLQWSLSYRGPCYLRLTRQNLSPLKRPVGFEFSMGRWQKIMEIQPESDLVCLATGGLVEPTLLAVERILKETEKRISVVNANWIQPFDNELLSEVVHKKVKKVMTLEDHYVKGGLCGLVSEWFSQVSLPEGLSRPQVIGVGVREFGQSGTPEENYDYYGFNAEKLYLQIKKELLINV